MSQRWLLVGRYRGGVKMERVDAGDVDALRRFLRAADLTVSGLDPSTVDVWVTRNQRGAIVGSAGYELSSDTRHALIRSVAVSPAHRSSGLGTRLARFAIRQAATEGAESAWLATSSVVASNSSSA